MEEKQWYVVNTYSGHESKVKEKLLAKAESMGMEDYIFRVVIPEEKVIEVKDGVTKEKIKKMFPGYILVVNIDLANNKVNLSVDLFGQETSVEVEINQIQKA